MYAISFELDNVLINDEKEFILKRFENDDEFHNLKPNELSQLINKKIRIFFNDNNFSYKNSLFFGKSEVNSINCVLVIQKLLKEFPFLPNYIKDIRLLRIEENTSMQEVINYFLQESEKKSMVEIVKNFI